MKVVVNRAITGHELELNCTTPEVSSMKYRCLGVFRKEYFRLVPN